MYRSVYLDSQSWQRRLLYINCAHIHNWLHVGDFGTKGESLGVSGVNYHYGKCRYTTQGLASRGGDVLHDCWRYKGLYC